MSLSTRDIVIALIRGFKFTASLLEKLLEESKAQSKPGKSGREG